MKNFEIKVKIQDIDGIINIIEKTQAVYKYDMHQTDYYLSLGIYKEKIREINGKEIQKISYSRDEILGRKESKYEIQEISKKEKKDLLKQKKVLCIVDKLRKLWIYKNTRIHLDKVMRLGNFLELETVIKNISKQKGLIEFNEVLKLLKIDSEKVVPFSYSDLILKNQKTQSSSVLVNKFATF